MGGRSVGQRPDDKAAMSTHSTATVFIADDFENRNRVDLGDIRNMVMAVCLGNNRPHGTVAFNRKSNVGVEMAEEQHGGLNPASSIAIISLAWPRTRQTAWG